MSDIDPLREIVVVMTAILGRLAELSAANERIATTLEQIRADMRAMRDRGPQGEAARPAVIAPQ